GDLGTPQSSTYGGNSWVRHWHGDSPGCLRTWRVHGDIQSNFPCAAFETWLGLGSTNIGALRAVIGRRAATRSATHTDTAAHIQACGAAGLAPQGVRSRPPALTTL